MLWKDLKNWDRTRKRFVQWWNHEGMVLWVTAPKDTPWESLPEPTTPDTLEERWLNPVYRARDAEYRLSRTFFGGEAFPVYFPVLGPGSLGAFLGSAPELTEETVWYHPCITEPDTHPLLVFNPENHWFEKHMALINEGLKLSNGRFLVGPPDLIENFDTLSALRGNEELLKDTLDRPDFVQKRINEINKAYFSAYNLIFERIKDIWGGSTFIFDIWGPGKVAKVQCDASAMLSPEMFAEFVGPALKEQCEWLDYSLYHLDGTQCICHLDYLLDIKSLNAIEWTPQAGIPGGGSPEWYSLYKRILSSGKSVWAGAEVSEVIPLLDAVGPKGLYVSTDARNEKEANKLVEDVEKYR